MPDPQDEELRPEEVQSQMRSAIERIRAKLAESEPRWGDPPAATEADEHP